MYWHSPIPPAFMAIDSVVLDELFLANTGAAETQDDYPVRRVACRLGDPGARTSFVTAKASTVPRPSSRPYRTIAF